MTPALAFFLFLTQAQPAFDAASVKPNKSGAGAIGNHFGPKQASWSNVSLKTLILTAYQLQSYQLIGSPIWLSSDTWDIDARSETPTTMQEKSEMLQPLLADRFQLKFHRETRDLPEYKLVIAKSGLKLRSAKETDPASTRIAKGLIANRNMTISDLAGWLKGELGRPVLDDTRLGGRFAIKLEWQPDEGQPNSGGVVPTEDSTGRSIFSAIQEQLGLKLEAHKGPVEVLVIDQVGKPSAN